MPNEGWTRFCIINSRRFHVIHLPMPSGLLQGYWGNCLVPKVPMEWPWKICVHIRVHTSWDALYMHQRKLQGSFKTHKMSYCKISKSLESVRLGDNMFIPLSNVPGNPATILSRHTYHISERLELDYNLKDRSNTFKTFGRTYAKVISIQKRPQHCRKRVLYAKVL